jgi:hypothetical protein
MLLADMVLAICKQGRKKEAIAEPGDAAKGLLVFR